MSILLLRKFAEEIIAAKTAQGHETRGLLAELERLPDSYDALVGFGERLRDLPMRSDWPYVEPNELDQIWEECDPDRVLGLIGTISLANAAERARTAFLAAVCGNMLGKPLEVDPTLAEIRSAAESTGEWPLQDYVTEDLLTALGRRSGSAPETTRGNIRYVARDDDINYSVIGMLVLEQKGHDFTRNDLADLWLSNLPAAWTFGPERTFLLKAGIHSLYARPDERPLEEWVQTWNPRDEACGAAIRVDAYGYSCPGMPALAAELAWRDAGMTHRRTGIYGAMYVAAAIAAAFVANEPMDIFETALKYIPQRSRFHEIVSDCFGMVAEASDWLDGYERIHSKYGEYGHCQLYQECGQLINTARFATDIADAFCKQVAQGCDTDCFGEIIGSVMGAYFGPGYLNDRWIEPFNDDLRTTLAMFHDRSLESVAQRMAKLPALVLGTPDEQHT